MKITRVDAAPNPDIERGPDDDKAKRGNAIASAMNAAIASFDATSRADAEEEAGKATKIPVEAKDANGETLDKILSCIDNISKRFDAISSRMDAMESSQKDGAEAAMITDKKKKDALIATHRGGEEMGEEEGDTRPLKADKKDSYSDSDANRNELGDIQARADAVCSAWGSEVRKPFLNEPAHSYRRRVIEPLKKYSDSWKNVDLKELGPDALKVAEGQVLADAMTAASANSTFEGLPVETPANSDLMAAVCRVASAERCAGWSFLRKKHTAAFLKRTAWEVRTKPQPRGALNYEFLILPRLKRAMRLWPENCDIQALGEPRNSRIRCPVIGSVRRISRSQICQKPSGNDRAGCTPFVHIAEQTALPGGPSRHRRAWGKESPTWPVFCSRTTVPWVRRRH